MKDTKNKYMMYSPYSTGKTYIIIVKIDEIY